MSTVHGFPNALTDFGGNNSDPRYLAAAKAIGARVDTGSGTLYDLKDGHHISQAEADQRANQAGVAVDSNRQRAGYLNQVYDRNKAYIDPALQIGAGVLGGPLASALVGGALNYSNTHDLGSAALAGAENYGVGKLVGAIPGVRGVADDVGSWAKSNIPGVDTAINTANDVGSWWDTNVKQPVSGVVDKMGGKSSAAQTPGAGLSWGDVMKAIGGGVGAGLDYKQNADALNQRVSEYNRTTGNQEGQQAAATMSQLNRSPLADQAQYLLTARMGAAPTTFTPRDYTKGLAQMSGSATGGPQDQLAAGRQAAGNYAPGAGGVNTTALQLLYNRLKGSAFPTA